MTKQTIDNLQPGTLDGDSLFRTAEKINENFNEIYSHFGDGQHLDDGYAGLKGLNAGLITSAGAGGYNVREILAGSTAVSVINGTGSAGNPTIDLPDTGVLSAGSSATVFADVGLTVDVKGRIVSISTPTLLTSAQTQATNAASSATAAATSATASATSATAAAASATSAANDVATIGTSLADAATHATNAGTSATAAATSATTATTQVGLATTQATNASNSATAASTSETNASNSATAAATSETNAGNSATAAATSATNAAASLASMGNNVTQAQTAATNAANSFDAFDDIFLGAKSSAPTVDNDGDALQTGALYFNTTSDTMFVRTSGGSWTQAGSAVNGTTNRQSYIATAGQTSFSATYDVGYIDVYLNGIKLSSSDFTATNGSSFALGSAASAGDQVDSIAYGAFSVANHYTKTEADTLLAAKATTADLTTTNNNLTTTNNNLTTTNTNVTNLTTTVGTKAPLNSPNFTGTPQIGGSNIITDATVPAAGLSTSFVAEGTIGANVTVGLRSDGKVEVITGVAQSIVGPVVYDSNGAQQSAGAAYYDPDQGKIVVIYRDEGNSNYPTVIVGSLSSTTITFPSSGVVMGSYDAHYHHAIYDPDTNMGVVVYQRGDAPSLYALYSHQVSVSGNTPTVHPNVTVNGTGSTYHHNYITMSYNTSADKVLITYQDYDRTNSYMAKVGTVNASSPYQITWAAEVEVTNENNLHHGTNAYNATLNQHLILYRLASGAMAFRIGTISGTTLTLDSQFIPSAGGHSATPNWVRLLPIPSTSNYAVVYQDAADSNKLTAFVVSVSGTTLSTHTIVKSDSCSGQGPKAIYDPDQGQIAVVYDHNSTGLATLKALKISGTSLTWDSGATQIYATSAFTDVALIYDTTNDKIRAIGRSSQSPKQGIAFTLKLAVTNVTSFIGFSNASATNGNTLDVTVKGGVASGLSGLTVLSDYYVQSDGSVTTTSTAPAVKIGTALSASKIGMIGFS